MSSLAVSRGIPKVRAAEFLRWPEDGHQYELIEGDPVMSPSPLEVHQRIVGRLLRFLDEYFDEHQIGRVWVSPFDVHLDPWNVFQPDLVVVLKEHAKRVTAARIEGAPDLVVEVLSPATAQRDRSTKLAVYARSGVREVWLIDPKARRTQVHRRSGGTLVAAATLGAETPLESPLLPGFGISLRRLLR